MKIRIAAALAGLSLLATSWSVAQPIAGRRIADPREVIALEEGVWDALITSPSSTAGGKPKTVTGVQINELRSGGMWMLNRMSANGGTYEGTGIWGYDATTGRYLGAWADNGIARIRMDDGTWDPDTNTMTWTAEAERPNGKRLRMRAVSTFNGNTRTYRSFAQTDAGEIPLSTVVFTRRPK
jgi:hypothetical protein